MKYILACLFSLGIMAGVFAQGDTTQQQEGGMITCMYLDESTIACFSPMEYEMGEQQEGFHYGQPHDSLFNEHSQGTDSLLQQEGTTKNNQIEPEDDEDLIQKEPGVKLDEEGEPLNQSTEQYKQSQSHQHRQLEEDQSSSETPSTESPDAKQSY